MIEKVTHTTVYNAYIFFDVIKNICTVNKIIKHSVFFECTARIEDFILYIVKISLKEA